MANNPTFKPTSIFANGLAPMSDEYLLLSTHDISAKVIDENTREAIRLDDYLDGLKASGSTDVYNMYPDPFLKNTAKYGWKFAKWRSSKPDYSDEEKAEDDSRTWRLSSVNNVDDSDTIPGNHLDDVNAIRVVGRYVSSKYKLNLTKGDTYQIVISFRLIDNCSKTDSVYTSSNKALPVAGSIEVGFFDGDSTEMITDYAFATTADYAFTDLDGARWFDYKASVTCKDCDKKYFFVDVASSDGDTPDFAITNIRIYNEANSTIAKEQKLIDDINEATTKSLSNLSVGGVNLFNATELTNAHVKAIFLKKPVAIHSRFILTEAINNDEGYYYYTPAIITVTNTKEADSNAVDYTLNLLAHNILATSQITISAKRLFFTKTKTTIEIKNGSYYKDFVIEDSLINSFTFTTIADILTVTFHTEVPLIFQIEAGTVRTDFKLSQRDFAALNGELAPSAVDDLRVLINEPNYFPDPLLTSSKSMFWDSATDKTSATSFRTIVNVPNGVPSMLNGATALRLKTSWVHYDSFLSVPHFGDIEVVLYAVVGTPALISRHNSLNIQAYLMEYSPINSGNYTGVSVTKMLEAKTTDDLANASVSAEFVRTVGCLHYSSDAKDLVSPFWVNSTPILEYRATFKLENILDKEVSTDIYSTFYHIGFKTDNAYTFITNIIVRHAGSEIGLGGDFVKGYNSKYKGKE